MRTWILKLTIAGVLCLAASGAAAQDTTPDFKLAIDDKAEVVKGEKESAEPGDMKAFTIVTDKNISELQVGAEYKSNGSFFEVTEILSKGAAGGKFAVKRTGGARDPGRRWTRVLGKGPISIESRETLLDRFLSGGVLMYPIAFLLLVGIIIAINSLWVYRRGKQCPPRFVDSARGAITDGDFEKFNELAAGQKGLFASICCAMMADFRTSTEDDIRTRCESVAIRQVSLLRTPLRGLNFIASVAPLLGLLGTVIGMIICFDSLSGEAASAGKSQAMAGGIKVALLTTAAGLSVAVPSLFVYFIFNQKLNLIVADCQTLATEFVHRLARSKRGGAARPQSAAKGKKKKPPAPPDETEETDEAEDES